MTGGLRLSHSVCMTKAVILQRLSCCMRWQVIKGYQKFSATPKYMVSSCCARHMLPARLTSYGNCQVCSVCAPEHCVAAGVQLAAA